MLEQRLLRRRTTANAPAGRLSVDQSFMLRQKQSIDEFPERDGCLLLWLEGNVLFSLNESALVIWSEMERNSTGVSIGQLVEFLEDYYLPEGVSRLRLRRDVEQLITTLSNRGFLTETRNNSSDPVYRIKEDVFRTVSDDLSDAGIEEQSKTALAYRPNDDPESSRLRALADTWLGLAAIILYEIVLRVCGFGRLCVMVERWPMPNRRVWLPIRVRQICAGIDRAQLWYPKKVLCLQHSAVVTCLLRRQGIPAQMFFGARRKPFYAHAWSEIHGIVVNDEQTVRNRYPRFIRCRGNHRSDQGST